QLGLGEPGVVTLATGQLVPFRGQSLVEQRLRAGDGAVEPATPQRFPALPAGPLVQVVQAVTALADRALAQQLAQGVPRARPGQHLLADRVDRGADVVRRRQRIRAALPRAVAV